MQAREDTIRQYDLYGESGQLPDVMHCESIAARSALHDWELVAHRHAHLHQLLLLRRGAGRAQLDDARFALGPGALLNVPPGTVHALRFEPGSDGLVVTWTQAMLDQLLDGDAAVRRCLARPWMAAADPALDSVALQLAEEYASRAAARALVLRGLGCTLLARAARLGASVGGASHAPPDSRLQRGFEELLEAHFREHWRVADYARALAVTPTHLSRVLRGLTGQSASGLIDARLVREARRQLAFTNLRVASVAYALGFADPALFSRVFTRSAGCSPRAFRQQLDARQAR